MADLLPVLQGVDHVFHHAAEPGVRRSWGDGFQAYADNNVVATQRLLEAARSVSLRRFVFASSSSVYGEAAEIPVRETTLPWPISPYGVTKLAAEHLCVLYAHNFGIPTVSLRYFTVYGPRQRPDMGFSRFIRAILGDSELTLYGDGEQTRDFTFIDDIVRASVSAAQCDLGPRWGQVYNVGGGSRASINTVISLLEAISGRSAKVVRLPCQPGDARHTFADCSSAQAGLGYSPEWSLEYGLEAQMKWQSEQLGAA